MRESCSTDQFGNYINDQHYKRIKEKWRYMVRFPASNNTHRNNVGSATSRQQSKFNNKSFIGFVSEDEIQKSLSENCVGCFVHKYFGTLRQDVVRYFKHRRYADIRRRRNQPPGSIYLKKSLQRPPIPFK